MHHKKMPLGSVEAKKIENISKERSQKHRTRFKLGVCCGRRPVEAESAGGVWRGKAPCCSPRIRYDGPGNGVAQLAQLGEISEAKPTATCWALSRRG